MVKTSYLGTTVRYLLSPITAILFVFVFFVAAIPEILFCRLGSRAYRFDEACGTTRFPPYTSLVYLFTLLYCIVIAIILLGGFEAIQKAAH